MKKKEKEKDNVLRLQGVTGKCSEDQNQFRILESSKIGTHSASTARCRVRVRITPHSFELPNLTSCKGVSSQLLRKNSRRIK